MKKIFKIIIIVIIALVILAGIVGTIFLIQLNRSKITDTEAKEILDELVPKAEEINEIIWGKGLKVDPNEPTAVKAVTAAQYRMVAEDSKYKNVNELKYAVDQVYARELITKTINYIAFDGSDDSNADYKLYPRYVDVDGYLNIDITNEGFELKTKIFPDTAKVVKCFFDKVDIKVDCLIDNEKSTLTLKIIKQKDGWRLLTPTY